MVAAPAAAQPSFAEIADTLDQTGWFVEDGTDVDADRIDELSAALSRRSLRVGLVVLDSEPTSNATRLAEDLLDELLRLDQVAVVTPTEIGLDSVDHDVSELNAALDASLDDFDDPAEGLRVLFESLNNVELDLEEPATSEGDGSALPWLLGGLVVVGAVGFLVMRRRSGGDRGPSVGDDDLSAAAALVVDLDESVTLADDAAAEARYEAAVAQWKQLQSEREAGRVVDPHDAALVRWDLECVRAMLVGDPLPPQPEKPAPPPDPTPPNGQGVDGGGLGEALGGAAGSVLGGVAGGMASGARSRPPSRSRSSSSRERSTPARSRRRRRRSDGGAGRRRR